MNVLPGSSVGSCGIYSDRQALIRQVSATSGDDTVDATACDDAWTGSDPETKKGGTA